MPENGGHGLTLRHNRHPSPASGLLRNCWLRRFVGAGLPAIFGPDALLSHNRQRIARKRAPTEWVAALSRRSRLAGDFRP